MKNELYRDIFEAVHPDDNQEVELRKMWKEKPPVLVLHNGKMEEGWRIVGVFAKEGDEPLKVRVFSPDQTFMMTFNADEFLKWQKGLENFEK